MSCHDISCHVMTCNVMTCHGMSCQTCRVMTYHVVSCPVGSVGSIRSGRSGRVGSNRSGSSHVGRELCDPSCNSRKSQLTYYEDECQLATGTAKARRQIHWSTLKTNLTAVIAVHKYNTRLGVNVFIENVPPPRGYILAGKFINTTTNQRNTRTSTTNTTSATLNACKKHEYTNV